MHTGTDTRLKTIGTAGLVGGAAIGGGISASQSNQIGPRDISPIEHQLQRQHNLLNELHAVAHNLIDSIKPVLRYDPRESPQPETNEKPVCPSCALEREIDARNEMLADKIRLLSQVREVICL